MDWQEEITTPDEEPEPEVPVDTPAEKPKKDIPEEEVSEGVDKVEDIPEADSDKYGF